MSSNKAKILLVGIFVFMIAFKLHLILQKVNYNLDDETGLFWTESALQHRNAKVVAVHGVLPSVDQDAQYPEGLEIKKRLTVLMETTSGYFYRFFIPKAIPFHIYLIMFIAIFSSLSIFPLYSSINAISKRKDLGLIGAAFYAVTPAIYTTVKAPGFELQDFALPLIFFHIYLFIRAMKTARGVSYSYAFLSASFLFAALAAWHLAQFYYVLFVIFVSICFLILNEFKIKPFYVISGLCFLAGLIIPTQQSARFIISFSMLLSYALIISSIIPRSFRTTRRLSFFLLSGGAVALTLYISYIKVPEYRFVYGLIFNKIRYLGIRPSDPSLLNWKTLVMWVSPFTGPTFEVILRSMGPLLLLGIIGVTINIGQLLRKKLDITSGFFLFFSLVFIPLYLLLIRLDAFLVWFLPLQAVILFKTGKKFPQLLMTIGLITSGFLLFVQPHRGVGPDKNYLLGFIKFIRHNTGQNDAVLTSFPYGPTVLAYTGRPIILHPKFEAKGITDKIEDFEHAIYKDEDYFYMYCRKYRVGYFLYQIDMLLARGPESMRFRTHNLTITRDCVAYRFHFRPETLKHFRLVYSNPQYRIYRVLESGRNPGMVTSVYFRVYDDSRFNLKKLGIL